MVLQLQHTYPAHSTHLYMTTDVSITPKSGAKVSAWPKVSTPPEASKGLTTKLKQVISTLKTQTVRKKEEKNCNMEIVGTHYAIESTD